MAELTYLWLGAVAGLAASPHCAGMCGAFPLHLAQVGRGRPLARHALYAAGKLLTYAFLGALAGAGGKLFVESRLFVASREILAYAAGGALLLFGLSMLGWLPPLGAIRGQSPNGPAVFARRPNALGHSVAVPEWHDSECPSEASLAASRSGRHAPCSTLHAPRADTPRPLLHHFLAPFLSSPSAGSAFLLGVGTGFLPCPITFAVLAVAASAQSVSHGLLTLTGLGLGTAPALLAIGLSGSLFEARVRRIGLRGAGAIVLLLGLVTLLRPTGLLCRVLPSGWGP